MNFYLQLYLNSYRGLSKPAWMLALTMLINRSGAMVIPFLGVYLSSELQFSVKDTGIVLSCFGVGAVCGSALGGWLSDKVGNFNVQFYCLLLTIPVFCVLPHLQSLSNVALAVFLLGLITETFRPANSVSITSYATPDSLTRAISLNRMAMNLGFSIGPALGGLLAGWSYSWLFYGNAISTAMAAGIFYFYFRNKEGRHIDSALKKNANVPGVSLWKDTPFIVFCVLCSLYCVCFFQLLSTLPLFYKQHHHLSEWGIGLILAYSGLVVFSLEMVLVHFAEKRWSAFRVINIG
ncbi:MAG: MFS transporter, partial [Sphingobacteriales bacterium]